MRLGKTLQLYLLKNFWAALLSVIFIFIFLVFFANLLSNLDEFIAAKLPFKQFVNYYLYTIPMVFIICLPISVLLSVMRIFRNLSLSNEYVALITSGISLNVMIFPLAVSCILLSYISFFVSDKIAPVTNYKRKIMINEKFKSFKVIKNKNIMGKKGKQYYLNEYQIENKIIKGLMISEANEKDKVTLRTFAETAAWTGDQWKCQGVKIQPYNDNGLPIKPENYTEYFLKDIIKPDEILISKDESN
ncbi:MAG: permease, partial [uncultured bacterium]